MKTKTKAAPAPPPEASFPRWVLPAIIAVYCLLALSLIVSVPIGKAPDETAHIEYVEYLAARGEFPVFRPLGANAPGYEFHQPPLYYLACLPLWIATGPGAGAYACRFVSLLFGAATLVLLWGSARRLFPQSRELPVLAAGFAAVFPMHVAAGASGGNDAAAGFFCAAMLWCLARGAAGWTWRDGVCLGASIGLGMLAKSTSLGVALPALSGACILALHSTAAPSLRRKALLSTLAVVTAMALLVCGWWLARNIALYGDPLGARIFEEGFKDSPSRTSNFFAGGVALSTYLRALLLVMFTTAWGFFGGPMTALQVLNPFGTRGPAPDVIPALLPMLFCAAATVAAILGHLRWLRGGPASLAAPARTVFYTWVVALLLVVLLWARFNVTFFQAQARYLHPALLPITLFAALGWWQLFFGGESPSSRGWKLSAGFGLLLAGLTLWNAFGWRTLV